MANFAKIPRALKKRAAQIELLLMDVDGTMTDGGVTLLSQTEEIALEIKTFDAHDGQGLTLAHTAGLRTGCITGRQSSALLRRAREMNMEFIYMKQALKMPAYEEIVRKAAASDSVVAYVSDDLPDLPVMRRVGLAVAVQPEACLSLRGQERKAVAQVGTHALREVFSGIREAYEFAWRRAASHLNQAEKQTFPDHPIFITGGGSLIPGLTEALSNDPARLNFKRKVRPLERPHDLYLLDDKPIPNDDLVFLSAAYGLSYHPDEIPPTYETEPEPRPKELYIGLGVIYEK